MAVKQLEKNTDLGADDPSLLELTRILLPRIADIEGATPFTPVDIHSRTEKSKTIPKRPAD
jgi:hypothetical protein